MPDTSTRQLGQIALDRGLVSAGQLREALDEFRQRKAAGSRMPLGEVLVEMGHLTRPQLEQLLGAQGGKKGPRQIIAGFELVRKLGEGGMGATYLARQESMDRLVALKILRKSLSRDEEFVARFRREAQLAGKLDHVNIVQAIDVGEAAGFHYLIMEYVEGRNLNDLLPESGPMSEELALHFVIQIARALGFADKQDIIHRDIKPDNIMVTAENIAKLCDFGLARQSGAESKLTQTGTAMGTPHYVSPEQARGDRAVDIRSDIYSLGATLYHLVTGETPFSGSSAVVVMTKHLTEQLPWPQDINPGLSESCALVISRMMAKDPADRYQTPAELITDLEMAIDGKTPGEANLAPGLSSVATRGTVPIVVQPLDAKPRRYRQTHLLAPAAGTDPTMPMIAASGSSPAGSRLKLLVAAAGAAALLVIALLIWSLAGGPAKTPDSPERDKGTPPPNGQQAVPDKQQQELRAMYAYAQKWWKDHPDEFEEARRKFEGMRGKAGGVLAMQIEDALREIDKAEQQAVTGVFEPIEKKARQLAGVGDFDTALAGLDRAPRSARERAGRQIDELKAELKRKAEEQLKPIMDDAERLSREGQPRAALERLKKLAGARYAPITGGLAALKVRLEKEKSDTGALAAKREEAAVAKTLTVLLDAVDLLLRKGDREAATRTLNSRKQALPATTRRQLAPQLAAMTRIIAEMNLFEAAHHRAVKALVGKRVSIKSRKGASYAGKVTAFSEEKGFIEVERSYSIGGQSRTKRYKIKFEDLADGELEKLVKGREPTTPQAFMAMAVMAIHAGDVHFAPDALKEAGENPLKDYYARKLKAVKKNTGDDRARWEWEHEVLPQVRKKYTPEQASKLVGQLEAWLRENDGTGFHAEHQKEAKDILREARKHVGDERHEPDPGTHGEKVPESLKKFFKGKVKSFDQRSLEVEVHWDFSDPEQLKDFSALGGKWKIEKGVLLGEIGRRMPDSRVKLKAYFEDQCYVRVMAGVRRGKQAYLQLGSDRDRVQLGMDFLARGGKSQSKAILARNAGEWRSLANLHMAKLRPSPTYEMKMNFTDRSITATLSDKKIGSAGDAPDKQVRISLGLLHSFSKRSTIVVFDDLHVRGRLDRPWFQQNIEGKPGSDPGEHRPRPGPGPDGPRGPRNPR